MAKTAPGEKNNQRRKIGVTMPQPGPANQVLCAVNFSI
jgi:hypothetical protein